MNDLSSLRSDGIRREFTHAHIAQPSMDARRTVRQDGRMASLTGLMAASRAFASLAAQVDADAPVRNEIWPTAGAMIDHLGNIQGWVTRIVSTGKAADRTEFTRPPERERVEWFRQTSGALVETLEVTDPGRACWALWGAQPVVAFWRRRMTNEATKHLWDLRTAVEQDPPMPEEASLEDRAAIMDEFVELLVPAARKRAIEPLPRDVLLVAEDLGRAWLFSREWEVTSPPLIDLRSTVDADALRADVGDLVLFVWARASPWDLRDRFRIDDGDAALRAFSRTPVHL